MEGAAPAKPRTKSMWKPQDDDEVDSDFESSRGAVEKSESSVAPTPPSSPQKEKKHALKDKGKEKEATMNFFEALKQTDPIAPAPRRNYRLPRTVSSYLETQPAPQPSNPSPAPLISKDDITMSASAPSLLSSEAPSKERIQRASFVPAIRKGSGSTPRRSIGPGARFDVADRQESDAALEFLKRAEFFAALDRIERHSSMRNIAVAQPQTVPAKSQTEPTKPEEVLEDEIELLERFINEVEGRRKTDED